MTLATQTLLPHSMKTIILRRHWRMATDKNKASDEYGMLITQFLLNEGVKPDEIDDVMIASVVPTVMHSLTNGVNRYLDCSPMVVGPGIKTGMISEWTIPRAGRRQNSQRRCCNTQV